MWLRYAASALKEIDPDAGEFNISEMHLNISHTLGERPTWWLHSGDAYCATVRALLGTDEPGAGHEALQILDTLKQVGDTCSVWSRAELTSPEKRSSTASDALGDRATLQRFIAKLRCILCRCAVLPNARSALTAAVVSRITRSLHITEANHRLYVCPYGRNLEQCITGAHRIMYYLHCLKAFRQALSGIVARERLIRCSLAHAIRALNNYISQRLVVDDDRDRIESSIVTLIWMAVSNSQSPEAGASLCQDLHAIHTAWKQILTAKAAHAAALVGLQVCHDATTNRHSFCGNASLARRT